MNIPQTKKRAYVLFFNTKSTNQAQDNVLGAVVYNMDPLTVLGDPQVGNVLLENASQTVRSGDFLTDREWKMVCDTLENLTKYDHSQSKRTWYSTTDVEGIEYHYQNVSDWGPKRQIEAGIIRLPLFVERFRASTIRAVQRFHLCQMGRGRWFNAKRRVNLELAVLPRPIHWTFAPAQIPCVNLVELPHNVVKMQTKAKVDDHAKEVRRVEPPVTFVDPFSVMALTENLNNFTAQRKSLREKVDTAIADFSHKTTLQVGATIELGKKLYDRRPGTRSFDRSDNSSNTLQSVESLSALLETFSHVSRDSINELQTVLNHILSLGRDIVKMDQEIQRINVQLQVANDPAQRVETIEQTLMSGMTADQIKMLRDYRKLLKQVHSAPASK